MTLYTPPLSTHPQVAPFNSFNFQIKIFGGTKNGQLLLPRPCQHESHFHLRNVSEKKLQGGGMPLRMFISKEI